MCTEEGKDMAESWIFDLVAISCYFAEPGKRNRF